VFVRGCVRAFDCTFKNEKTMSETDRGLHIEGYERIVLKLKSEGRDPAVLAAVTGGMAVPSAEGRYAGEGLAVRMFGEEYLVAWPDFTVMSSTGKAVPDTVRGILLYYLLVADGREKGGRWLSLAELPGGMFYKNAYQGYTGARLAQAFYTVDEFRRCALDADGAPFDLGDAAFVFRALPKIDLIAVYWAGDDEFPPSAAVLFDSAASGYLPTDICAVLGRVLTDRILEVHSKAE